MASEVDPESHFREVSDIDSKSFFKPSVVSLVVSQSDTHGPNVMTASWWMIAGYNPLRYMLGVGQYTHTYDIIEENPEFVLAAPSTEMVDALTLCGSVSGADVDKIDQLGLETIPGKGVDVPLLADAVGNIECRVLDSFSFEGITYYIADVENAYVQQDALDGRILSPDAEPLAYLGSDWENEDDEEKHRYYLEFGEENIASYDGKDALEAVSEDK